tara:strand:- start:24943 stop:25170 length:228 start_codon:yes stop_codon:yes gene_type:complete
MPSKKTTTVKKIEKKTPIKEEPKGEEIAGIILSQLKSISIKLNDLNKRVSNIETLNIKPMEYTHRLSKVEGRLGL